MFTQAKRIRTKHLIAFDTCRPIQSVIHCCEKICRKLLGSTGTDIIYLLVFCTGVTVLMIIAYQNLMKVVAKARVSIQIHNVCRCTRSSVMGDPLSGGEGENSAPSRVMNIISKNFGRKRSTQDNKNDKNDKNRKEGSRHRD